MLREFFQSLLKRTSLLLVIVGATILITGAAGGISASSFNLSISDTGGRITIIIAGLALMGFGIYLMLHDTLPKRQLKGEILLNEGFNKIYQFLKSVKDDEIREYGFKIIHEAKERIRRVHEGVIVLGPEYVYAAAIARMKSTKTGEAVWAVHTAVDDISYLYAWEDVKPLAVYFQENLEAKKRGVKIKRIFVVKKTYIVDPSRNYVNERALRIMREHTKACEEVYVVWFEDVYSREIIEDFIVFSEAVVQKHEVYAGGLYYQVTIYKHSNEIKKYIERFAEIAHYGEPLEKVLQNLR